MVMNVVGSQGSQNQKSLTAGDMCRHSEKTWPILDTAGCSQQKKLIFSAASYFVNRSPEIKGTDSEQRGRSIELHHMILRVTHDLEKGSGFSKLGAGCTAKSLEDC